MIYNEICNTLIIKVLETGEFEEYTNSDFEPNEDSVYIFISVYNKTCYLWYGKNSGVRKQFIAANEGRKIKLDTGFNSCNVTHEGAEEEFEKVLNEWRNDSTRASNPAKVIQEQRERMADMIVQSAGGSASSSKPASKPASAPPVRTSPAKSSSIKPTPAPSTSSSSGKRVVELKPVPTKVKSESNFNITTEDSPVEEEPKRVVKQTLAPPVKVSSSPSSSGNYSTVLDKLERMKSFGEVENHSRKYIVTDDQVFTISESNGKYDIKEFDEVVTGIFEVKNFHPRFLMENSKIVAIELWKKD